MTKTFIVLATAAALSQPALAETLVHDGVTYTYTVEQRGKTTLISGQDSKTRQPFRLRVVGTRVSGTTASGWVSFSTRDVVPLQRASAPAVIATR